MKLALSQNRALWRVIWLGCVAATTVFWANSAFAQVNWDSGSRSPDSWYYCYGSYIADVWNSPDVYDTPWQCDTILWQQETGNPGQYDSVEFAATMEPLPGEFEAAVRGYILAPAGIYQWEYSCNATMLSCRDVTCVSGCAGGGVTGGIVQSSVSGGSSQVVHDSTAFSLAQPSVPAGGACNATNLDTVGRFRSSSGTIDYLWSRSESLIGSLASNAVQPYSPYFLVGAWSQNSLRLIGGGYSCQITDWDMLAATDPWVPGPDDLAPSEPTPTPEPGTGWATPVAWVPLTESIYSPVIGITEPITTTCATIIPPVEFGADEIEDEIPTGFGWLVSLLPIPEVDMDGVQWCGEEYGIELEIFGIDVANYLLIMLGLGATGVLVSIFKRA